MKNSYSTKQIRESVAYWRGVLKNGRTTSRPRTQIREALEKWESELNERDLNQAEVKALADYIEKNKVDVSALLKIGEKDLKPGTPEYDQLKGMSKALGLANKSVPKVLPALQGIFKGRESAAKDPAKAAAAIEKDPEKAAKEIGKAKAAAEGGEGKGGEAPAVSTKVEKAVDKELDSTDPSAIGLGSDAKAAEDDAAAKPIGEMNLMDRLRRLHNATKNNVIRKLQEFLPFKTADGAVDVENSCVGANGNFAIPTDGNMFITVWVKVDKTNRQGFKKFIGGMFGKAMNEDDLEELTEGVFSEFFGGLWKGSKEAAKKMAAGAKEGAQKAAEAYRDNLAKVNEEMKKRVGVAAIQEYVMRFCGKALAKKVNYQNIKSAIEDEGTESARYVFTGCVKVSQ